MAVRIKANTTALWYPMKISNQKHSHNALLCSKLTRHPKKVEFSEHQATRTGYMLNFSGELNITAGNHIVLWPRYITGLIKNKLILQWECCLLGRQGCSTHLESRIHGVAGGRSWASPPLGFSHTAESFPVAVMQERDTILLFIIHQYYCTKRLFKHFICVRNPGPSTQT